MPRTWVLRGYQLAHAGSQEGPPLVTIAATPMPSYPPPKTIHATHPSKSSVILWILILFWGLGGYDPRSFDDVMDTSTVSQNERWLRPKRPFGDLLSHS